MESSNQLTILNFNNLSVPIYGSEDEPVIKCSDLLIHVLGYRDSSCAQWFRNMSEELKQIYFSKPVQSTGQQCFNEQGVYWALMKSNRPIAQQFQLAVCNWLKQMRMQKKQLLAEYQLKLEEAQKEIEELKQPRYASLYKIKQGNRLLYIGQDKSKQQNRPQQHFTERRKIAQNYQLIDIYMATVNEQDISIETQSCLDHEADDMEKDMIEKLQPEFNQAMNGKIYNCPYCKPQKTYKNRGSFESHMAEKHGY